jgi:hypothetical protein
MTLPMYGKPTKRYVTDMDMPGFQPDMRMIDAMRDAPQFDPNAQQNFPRLDAQRVLERELKNINTPMPEGIEARIRQLPKMRGQAEPPWAPPPGQGPKQVAPAPADMPQPQPMPLRSVLLRDNAG